jgi:queuine tRNA-ribosyltransferase
MPVGTQASVKGLTPRMLWEELGAGIILANTYHLYLRPGHEVVRELGGVQGFMSWPGAVLTDSGGFQVFSLAGLRKVTEDGVIFRSHLDGSEHVFTPESTVDVQRALGSDVMMVLDECTEYPASRERARASMETTLRWAERAFRHWRGGGLEHRGGALFPIVQGSMFADLRRECAERLVALDAPGYAVGGLSVGEPRGMSYEMVEASEPLLPRDKPRYVMGVGMLAELGEYVALGVDMMDCVLPTRNARNGYLFTSEGPVVIKNAQWARDGRPVDENCPCYTCRNFSRGYLRHLFLAREMLFGTLATIHNVFTYLDRMKRIREAILLGDLPEYLALIRAKDEERS